MDQTVYERLINAALRFVSYRPRSTRELRDFCKKTLRRHNTSAPLVEEQVMQRMADLGYADDTAFARWWVSQRTTSTPRGSRFIVAELVSKGISRDDAEAAVAAAEGSEEKRAMQSIRRKLQVWLHLDDSERNKKLYEYLYRRGFTTETIRTVVDGLSRKR